jgi:hypothetical protein
MSDHVIEAAAADVFEGLSVGIGGKADCTGCHQLVRDGDPVGVYIYSVPGREGWDLARVFCADCRTVEVAFPTLGAAEFVAHCRLAVTSDSATQSAHLVLRGVDVVDHASPEEGAEP